MDTVPVRKWGNSQGIRIPQAILKKLDINLSDELTIEVEDRAIVLRKRFRGIKLYLCELNNVKK